jgi:hypothetical protein
VPAHDKGRRRGFTRTDLPRATAERSDRQAEAFTRTTTDPPIDGMTDLPTMVASCTAQRQHTNGFFAAPPGLNRTVIRLAQGLGHYSSTDEPAITRARA